MDDEIHGGMTGVLPKRSALRFRPTGTAADVQVPGVPARRSQGERRTTEEGRTSMRKYRRYEDEVDTEDAIEADYEAPVTEERYQRNLPQPVRHELVPGRNVNRTARRSPMGIVLTAIGLFTFLYVLIYLVIVLPVTDLSRNLQEGPVRFIQTQIVLTAGQQPSLVQAFLYRQDSSHVYLELLIEEQGNPRQSLLQVVSQLDPNGSTGALLALTASPDGKGGNTILVSIIGEPTVWPVVTGITNPPKTTFILLPDGKGGYKPVQE